MIIDIRMFLKKILDKRNTESNELKFVMVPGMNDTVSGFIVKNKTSSNITIPSTLKEDYELIGLTILASEQTLHNFYDPTKVRFDSNISYLSLNGMLIDISSIENTGATSVTLFPTYEDALEAARLLPESCNKIKNRHMICGIYAVYQKENQNSIIFGKV